ncbi:uncharacterized protein [Typha latifolia]|uniref:uncharacterized protein n=1 Tax=Typha latifolia TaxID=4733 RepID=UPI003C2EF123
MAHLRVIYRCLFIMMLFLHLVSSSASANQVDNNNQKTISCSPCSQAYVAHSYSDDRKSLLLDSKYRDILAEEIGSTDLCKWLPNYFDVLKLLDLHRHLDGEGSHRRLVSTLRFDNCSDAVMHFLDGYNCEAVIIEKLPNGVFSDPFELQHLVNHRVFLDAAVFGDTNLELPSALSNRSVVEIHMDLRHETLSEGEVIIELPLHARYPPLDSSGYARVEITKPDLFIRYRPKGHADPCLWAIANLEAQTAGTVNWQIPCGNEAHRGVVSSITFLSALVSALLIVLSAIYFPPKGTIKYS